MSTSFQLVNFDSVYKSFGPKIIFDGLTFTISVGDRIALIGDNGSGKTTLARMALGLERADRGSVWRNPQVSIGYMPQVSFFKNDTKTLRSFLLEAQGSLETISKQLEDLEVLIATLKDPEALKKATEEWDSVYQVFEQRGGYGASERSKSCLTALGLDKIPMDRLIKDLSGGEQRRLFLASLLFEQYSLLILDEPTNHLDQKAVEWLERYLADYQGAVWFITHDRSFLNRVANGVMELSSSTHCLSFFPGDYKDYLNAKHIQLSKRLKEYEEQREEVNSLKRYLKEAAFSLKRTSAPKDSNKMAYDHRGERHLNSQRKVISKVKFRLEELEQSKLSNPMPKGYTGIVFTPKHIQNNFGLVLEDVRIEMDGRVLIEKLSGVVRSGDRILLTGPNGCGKSTLLNLLAAKGMPSSGKIEFASTALIGYLDQEGVLSGQQLTLIEYLQKRFNLPEDELRSRLHRLALIEDQFVGERIEDLSLGQRRRIQILELMLSEANILLLDEPTNHLSPNILDELEKALLSFPGCVIAASHDRWFIERIATAKWEW